jgi:hypothetical protein
MIILTRNEHDVASLKVYFMKLMDKVNSLTGKGNALKVMRYIQENFLPLTWNIIAMKCIKLMIQKKVSPTNMNAESEFDSELLEAIHRTLLETQGKGLPIFN